MPLFECSLLRAGFLILVDFLLVLLVGLVVFLHAADDLEGAVDLFGVGLVLPESRRRR